MSRATTKNNETLVKVDMLRQDGTYVETSVELTKNLGNFENIKVRNTLGRPLYEAEHPRAAFKKLYEVVTDELAETLNRALVELGYVKPDATD